jgi:uridine phosphorylase
MNTSELPRILPLTGLTVGEVPPHVLVCGDPHRATQIARHLSQSSLLSEHRGYHFHRGLLDDRPVGVCSHGIGSPGAAIAFEELIAAGARVIIRVGTCGGLQPDLDAGRLVVARAAVDNTGFGGQTVPAGYPAVADPELTLLLRKTAREISGQAVPEGIVFARDNFYRGVELPHLASYQTMSQANVLAVEMECAALFIVGSLRGIRTGAILTVDGNPLATGQEDMESYQPQRQQVRVAVEMAIQAALNALSRLADDQGRESV